MRKLVVIVALAVLACGGSSSNGSSSGSNNNGSQDGSSSAGGITLPTGSVGGSTFLAKDAVASLQATGLTTSPCTLDIPGFASLEVAMTALALDFSSAADACSNLTASTCYTAATKSVRFVIANAALGSQAQVAPITTGKTYELMSDHVAACSSLPLATGLSGLSGTFTLAAGSSNDATDACSITSSAATGSIRIDKITDTEVQGYIDATFRDGGTLKGDFTAALCATGLDVCKIAQSAMSDMDADHPLEICDKSSSSTTTSGSQYACK